MSQIKISSAYRYFLNCKFSLKITDHDDALNLTKEMQFFSSSCAINATILFFVNKKKLSIQETHKEKGKRKWAIKERNNSSYLWFKLEYDFGCFVII